MQDERRAVLERVARGELSPAEAASLLEAMESAGTPEGLTDDADPRDWAKDWEDQPDRSPTPPPPPPTGDAATRIRVVRNFGSADVIGDPSVREAVADGPHMARREGDTLVIESQLDGMDMRSGWMFGWHQGPPNPHRMRRRERGRWGDVVPLRVRVNPDLPLDIETQAGRLRIRGVHGPIRANVQAGGTDIVDFRSPLDLTVQAGTVHARGRLDHGASHVHCEAGSVRIHLERGSSVRVTARTTLGKVVVGRGDARTPVTIGGGEGTLDIDGTMGAVRVTADE